MTDMDGDLVNILGALTNFIQDERVRAYNEGVDAARSRAREMARGMEAERDYWRKTAKEKSEAVEQRDAEIKRLEARICASIKP